MSKPIIGVLALQGAVDLHRPHIEATGAGFRAVKTPDDFDRVHAFILPGGESTTMLKLIENFNLWKVLARQFAAKPVWGICAGAILMAESVKKPSQKSFGLLPIKVERNGYGRQLESHDSSVNGYDVSFIRAPIITDSSDCEIIASHQNSPVWVRRGQYMATAFHPEVNLNAPSPMHQYFINQLVA